MGRIEVPITHPARGSFLFQNPRAIPPDGAPFLRNLRVEDGVVRSRDGSIQHYTAPNSNAVIGLFNLQFNDKTVRVLRCTQATGTSGATSALHYDTGSAWGALTIDNQFGSTAGVRYWAVTAPWASSTRGRIIISNNVKIKQWDGDPVNTVTDVSGGFPSKFGTVTSDGRLLIGNIVESGTQQLQRIRGTVPFLPAGNSTDWSGTGSFALDLREDSWAITGIFELNGRIFIGKERSVAVLIPTGQSTSPYNVETIVKNGVGVFVPSSFVQWGNFVGWIGEDDVHAFDGINAPGVGGAVRRELFRRLNHAALEQVTAIVDAQKRRVGWGLPLDGASVPSELWWLHMDDLHWEAGDPYPHSALSIYTSPPSRTYDDLASLFGDYNAMAAVASYDALAGPPASPKTQVLIGLADGNTRRFDENTNTDVGTTITGDYISPVIDVRGRELSIAGQRHTISDKDQLAVDEVAVHFVDRGSTYTAEVQITRDNGLTWTSLGQRTITTTGGASDGAPRFIREQFNARMAIGDFFQIRIFNTSAGARWGFTDAVARLDVVGRKL